MAPAAFSADFKAAFARISLRAGVQIGPSRCSLELGLGRTEQRAKFRDCTHSLNVSAAGTAC
jgi:hypothetical protein